jgi:hypothetical protein
MLWYIAAGSALGGVSRYLVGVERFAVALVALADVDPHPEKVLRLSLDLPIVVECAKTEERIQAILPELDRMIGGGLITLERARVIVYRPEG